MIWVGSSVSGTKILVGAVLSALVASFLFITHLAEPFSERRMLIELVLIAPLLLCLPLLRTRSSV